MRRCRVIPIVAGGEELDNRRMTLRFIAGLLWFACLTAGAADPGPSLVDDHAITLRNPRDIEARRKTLTEFIWGTEGFPRRRQPDLVVTNIPSPVRQLTSLGRVDELRFNLAPGLEGLAYHFVPTRPNGHFVVVHHGHACTLDDNSGPTNSGYGLQRTIHALLREGFGVLGVFMPRSRPGDCTGGHDKLFDLPVAGNGLRFFLEPTAIGLNYVKTQSRRGRFPRYRTFHMLGLSGGGWTTTVYAALDTTIENSFPVAGTIPLHLRSGGSVGDLEQFLPAFYRLAGYPDLYILGAHGRNRRQVQILVRRDDCCFGEAQHDANRTGRPYLEAMRNYERDVQTALETAGRGTFRLEIDDAAPSHMISHEAIERVILPQLKESLRK
ncbi:MAG TPA: hypothetical protein VJS65_00230 [Verrucomicrobiae bacterium]|nr:hypothetical protein [Verrucomicrobiae bacterium]